MRGASASSTIFIPKSDLYAILICIPQSSGTTFFLAHLVGPLPALLHLHHKYLSYFRGTFLVLIDGKNDDPQKILYYGFL